MCLWILLKSISWNENEKFSYPKDTVRWTLCIFRQLTDSRCGFRATTNKLILKASQHAQYCYTNQFSLLLDHHIEFFIAKACKQIHITFDFVLMLRYMTSSLCIGIHMTLLWQPAHMRENTEKFTKQSHTQELKSYALMSKKKTWTNFHMRSSTIRYTQS